MTRVRRRAACASLLFWSAVFGASADELTLREAMRLTAERNPAIAAFRTASDTTRYENAANALPPPTTFDAQFENFAGTGSLSGANALETTLQLSRVIELGGKASARRTVGDSTLDLLTVAQRAQHADIVATVARRFVHVLADQEELQAAHRAMRLAADARDAVEARLKAGATSPIALSRAEIALARAHIEQEHVEHELASSRVELASSWGDFEPEFDAVTAPLFQLPELEPVERYVQRLEASPELLKLAATARLIEARERLSRTQQTPNLTLNAGVRRLEGIDDQAFVAGFSIPLGSRARVVPELAALRSERARLELNEQTRRLELRATLFALYQEVLHARTEALALQTTIRPQAERMVQAASEGYRAGRFSLIELADAQQQLLAIQRDAIRAAAQFHTQLIEIERLTGLAVHTLVREESK